MGHAAAKQETQIVGRYAIYGEIATGGMASVHYGRLMGPVGFSRPVAIKRLHPQLAKEPEVRAMFIDEARLVSRIHHPNVVPTLDVIAADGELLLVMEYVHGESVARLARAWRDRREAIPLRIVLAIMTNVLHGLHAAHEAKGENGEPLEIVHRDVSPHNVLVGIDGVARVLDFGIARAAVRLESTREGIIKGKLAYMAPEQLGGAVVTRQADVYAASVVLWELLAGRRLFLKGDDGLSVLIDKMFRGLIEGPSVHRPGISAALDAVVLRGLERDPSLRFASAREMTLALESTGDLATPSEIGAWVEETAATALALRAAKLEDFERTSSKMRIASASSVEIDVLLADAGTTEDPGTGSGSRAPTGTKSALRAHVTDASESLSPAYASIPVALPRKDDRSETPARRFTASRAALAAGFLAVVAVAFGGVRIAGGDLGTSTRSLVPAHPGVVVIPSLPTCPAGTIYIPGGKFFMGSDNDLPMERPAHNVTLSPYCMDTFEVTTEDFRACSDRGACKRAGATNEWDGISDGERKTFDPLCNIRDPSVRAQHPINCVDWDMATIYCKAQGKRLPTEAEWEFAARGPDGRKYPWGDEEPSEKLLNACGKECSEWGRKNKVDVRAMFSADDGWATTAPVGSFPKGASRYGLQDVVGNVWEWVSDFHAEYSRNDQVDPQGPEKGEAHVIRGGAWNGGYSSWVRPTFRYKDVPEKRSYGIGFRCAKSL